MKERCYDPSEGCRGLENAKARASAGPCTRHFFSEQSPATRKTVPDSSPFHHRTFILTLPQQFKPTANMGFTDLVSDAGLTLLNNWVKTRSYIVG
jgi:hypothetical protein